jgi:hypothetical protein
MSGRKRIAALTPEGLLRIPANMLRGCQIGDTIEVLERDDGILLRLPPTRRARARKSSTT